ncbi:hypothetical protein BFS14_22240 [Serratia fonticola]|nr:hypothetical protein BFS14_22240 [Serratia fonticola]
MCAKIKIMPFYPLGIFLAHHVAGCAQQDLINRPSILMLTQQSLQRRGISRAEDVSQSPFADTVISVEQPPGIGFTLYVRPLFIGFTADNDFRFGVDILSYLFWRNFFKCRRTLLRLMPRTRAVSRHPEPFIAILTMVWCVSGLAPE